MTTLLSTETAQNVFNFKSCLIHSFNANFLTNSVMWMQSSCGLYPDDLVGCTSNDLHSFSMPNSKLTSSRNLFINDLMLMISLTGNDSAF